MARQTPTEETLLPPRYGDVRRVGRGGMGDIYRATDSTLGREVAVKVLAERYAQDKALRNRFKREALAAAKLSGAPSTVTIFDVGDHGGRPFIVMEYLHGGSLEDRLQEDGAQETGQAIEWLGQAAAALDAAHAAGIVHRDVKPANLLLDGEENVHVADFGIASAAGMASLTKTGTVLGTAGYLAPEQALGEGTTPASDRYALGVVGFELLTGRRPFEAESATAEAASHVHAPVPPISEHGLPEELDEVFERALEKDPEDRFPTCADFVAEIRDALARSAAATRVAAPVAAATAARPASRRLRPDPVLGGVALGLLFAGAALAVVVATRDGNEADADRAAATDARHHRGTDAAGDDATGDGDGDRPRDRAGAGSRRRGRRRTRARAKLPPPRHPLRRRADP